MVHLLLKPMPLLYFICQNCYALISYGIDDVYQGKIMCPSCSTWNTVHLNKDYDGVIKEEEKKKD